MKKKNLLWKASFLSLVFFFSCPLLSFADSLPEGGILHFRTHFGSGVSVVNRTLSGSDGSMGAIENNWDNIGNVLPWLQAHKDFNQNGKVEFSADPKDPTNRVLHLHNYQIGTEGLLATKQRSQYSLTQVPSGKWDQLYGENIFDKQFYRYRIYIPGDIASVIAFEERAPFYMIWEAHSWQFDEFRHAVNLAKMNNSDAWVFRLQQQNEYTKEYTFDTFLKNEPGVKSNVAVPFDHWFTLEIFFKYHETDGEFYAAIVDDDGNRQIIGRIQGQTQFGEKMRDQMIFKMYHGNTYTERLLARGGDGTHQYYDNFEIWSDYPPNYWSDKSHQPTVSLTASPSTITAGTTTTLTWSSTNATTCTASDGWSGDRALTNSREFSPTQTTTYTLTCTGEGGSASASTTVTVTDSILSLLTPPPPIANNPQFLLEIQTTQAGTLSFTGDCTFTPTTVPQGTTYLTLTNQTKKSYSHCQITFHPQQGDSQTLTLPNFTLSYRGDLNRDSKVDIFDFTPFVANFGKNECNNPADLNDDCKVDIFDFTIFLGDFGRSV